MKKFYYAISQLLTIFLIENTVVRSQQSSRKIFRPFSLSSPYSFRSGSSGSGNSIGSGNVLVTESSSGSTFESDDYSGFYSGSGVFNSSEYFGNTTTTILEENNNVLQLPGFQGGLVIYYTKHIYILPNITR